jgi:hypothetical protein
MVIDLYRGATSASAATVRTWDVIKIVYLNIYHLTLKLTSDEFHAILKQYDIIFLAETDILLGEEDAPDVPRGLNVAGEAKFICGSFHSECH